MAEQTPLIAMLVVGLGLAFIFGTLANRLKVSPLVGYLLAGVAVGPFTPGFIADRGLALQLADIGVILLMFGVGLHFSPKDLRAIRAVVVPGAVLQVALSTLGGIGVAWLIGWPVAMGIVFGLSLSIASTVVLMRALQDRRLMETDRGRLAMGWLIVQDLLTVAALVLLPPLAPLLKGGLGHAPDLAALASTLAITFGKLAVFVVLMLVVGRRVLPAILHYIAHTGSRELFRLAVLSVALGIAFVAFEIFGVSFALGSFFAGMMLSESPLSQRAAEESLPLRDAFAVLFFVAVGMLFNPSVLIRQPGALALTLIVPVVGAGAAFAILRAFGKSTATAAMIGVGLAQIGEFSFILANLGIGLGVLPPSARDLILGTSIVSIFVNPLLFKALGRFQIETAETPAKHKVSEEPLPVTALTDHAVVVGYGRVGRLICESLARDSRPFIVIEAAPEAMEQARKASIELIPGNAAQMRVLKAANLALARVLFVAIPEAFEAGQIVGQARKLNPRLAIVARAHFDAEIAHLTQHGADQVIMGEREIARAMLDWAKA